MYEFYVINLSNTPESVCLIVSHEEILIKVDFFWMIEFSFESDFIKVDCSKPLNTKMRETR